DPKNGEPILRKAIELDPDNEEALVALADVRAGAGDHNEALVLARRATSSKQATASTWRKRAFTEVSAGDSFPPLASLDRALALEPNNLGGIDQRAKLLPASGDKARAIEDIRALEKAGQGSSVTGALELAQMYERAGRNEDALRVLDALSEKDRTSAEVIALR